MGYDIKVIGVDTIKVQEFDQDGNILLGYSTSKPASGGLGYAKGCRIIDTDVATGFVGVYENIGTTSSCNFSVGMEFQNQPAQTAKTTDATLTTTELKTRILTVNQGAAGTSSLTLPLASGMDTAFPDAATDDAFEFSLINISTNAAEDATIITNTGWTLVGEMTVESNDADRAASAGRFLARKTGTATWTLYRIS